MAVEFIDYNFTVEVNEDTNIVEIRYEGLNADNLALLTTRVDVLEDAFALQSGTTTGTISGIQSDITALEAADITLQNNITAETNARIAADAALANSITLVAPPLQANIDAEAAARAAADAAEVVARNAAISAATAPIIADAVALTGTVNSHTATISAIAADQVTVNANVAALDASFDTLSADFAAWSADFTDVQDAVTAETAARIAADAAITAMITVPVSWKAPVRVATTAAGTLATDFEVGDTVDGVTLALGDRILIKNQAAGAENGIYTVNTTGAPTRATDMDSSSEVPGAITLVAEGTTNGDTLYFCSTNSPITLGTTALVFTQVSGGTNDGDKGDITVSAGGTTWTIDAGAVTLAKMANLATGTIIGRATAGTGVPEALTGTQATALLDTFTSGAKGLAPASGGGTTNYLRADGTWAVPAGGGGGGGGSYTVSDDGVLVKETTTAQSITHGTMTPITFNTEVHDDKAYFSSGTPDRFTVPVGGDGWYLILGTFAWAAGSSFDNYAILTKNGTTERIGQDSGQSGTAAAIHTRQVAAVVKLVAGDYVQLCAWQGSGSSKSLSIVDGFPTFSMNRLGVVSPSSSINNGASVRRESTLSVTGGNWTTLPFTIEEKDDNNYWNATNPERFTVKDAGWYVMSAMVQWDSGNYGKAFAFCKNNTVSAGGAEIASVYEAANGNMRQSISWVGYLEPNDYITVNVFTNTTSNVSAAWPARAAICRLGDRAAPANPKNDGVHIYRAASVQSIPNNTSTNLTFDTEVRDDGSYATLGTNNDRLTITNAGWYVISGAIVWEPNATGRRGLWLRRNSDGAIIGGAQVWENAVTGGYDGSQQVQTVAYLDAGETVMLRCFQDSGGSLNASLMNGTPRLSLHRLGTNQLPTGGTTGQALVKVSSTDGDVMWGNAQTVINYYDSHDPAAMSVFFCDFIGNEAATWSLYGATGGYAWFHDAVRVDGRPGIAVVGSGATNATSAAVIRHTSSYNTVDRANTRIPSGTDELSFEWCGKFSSISQTNGYMRFGLVNNVTTYNDSIYVDVQAGTVKLQCYSGGVNSNATFSTLPTADTFCHIEIRVNTTAARAYLNGVLVATVTSNLTTAGLDIVLQAGNLSGAVNNVMTTDYVRLKQVYGTPRAIRQSSTQYSIVGSALTHVDAPPTVPDSVDDEFEGTTLNSKWTWDNQSTGTATLTGGALKLTAALNASMSVQSLFQPLPSSGDWKYRAKIATQPLGNTNVAGITMKETATGKLVSFMLVYSSALYHQLVYFTNSTTYSSTPASLSGDPMMFGGMPWIYYEIEKVGTTLYFRFSRTGADGSWYNHSNASLTAHFTTGPDLIGLSAASQNASVPAVLQCDWFRKINTGYAPGTFAVNARLQPSNVNITPDTKPAVPNSMDDEFEGTGLDSKWAWRNQGSATATLSSGSLILEAPAVAGDNIKIIEQSVSGSWKYRAKVAARVLADYSQCGLCVINSSSGKVMTLGKLYSSDELYIVAKFNSVSSYNSSLVAGTNWTERYGPMQGFCYFEIEYNGTTLYFRASGNGVYFDTLGSEASATFLGTPDKIGLFAQSNNASNDSVLICDWFRRVA